MVAKRVSASLSTTSAASRNVALDITPLTPSQVSTLTKALDRWVQRHPEPDKQLRFLGTEPHSPREIAAAVRDCAEGRPNEFGRGYLRMQAIVISDGTVSFEDLIASVDRSATEGPELE